MLIIGFLNNGFYLGLLPGHGTVDKLKVKCPRPYVKFEHPFASRAKDYPSIYPLTGLTRQLCHQCPGPCPVALSAV